MRTGNEEREENPGWTIAGQGEMQAGEHVECQRSWNWEGSWDSWGGSEAVGHSRAEARLKQHWRDGRAAGMPLSPYLTNVRRPRDPRMP